MPVRIDSVARDDLALELSKIGGNAENLDLDERIAVRRLLTDLKSRHLERTGTVVRTQRDVITRTLAAGGSHRLLLAGAHRVKRLAACTERVKPSTCCTTYAQKVMK